MEKDKPTKTRSIAVDFDGTLATYNGFKGVEVLGEPIPAMIVKVKQALAEGADVTIFTARVNPGDGGGQDALDATRSYLLIAAWCQKHLGQILAISHEKSRRFKEMWDDRAKQVLKNTGVFLEELVEASAEKR